MFHRVRTDQQDERNEQVNSPAKSAAPAPEKARSYEPPQRTREIESREQPSQEKEKRFMTPQRDDRRDEQAEQQEPARSLNIPGGYSATQTRPSPGGYPGAAYSPSYKPADSLRGSSATLTIGQGITLSGEIEACEHLVVEGNVEAALKGAKLLEVAESGTYFGTVEIERATIAGRFEGDLTVNGRLTIRSTGMINGTIAYRELEIEAGAVLDGRLTPLKSDPQDVQRPTVQAKSKEAAAAIAKAREFRAQKEQEAANVEDDSLFSRKSAAE